MSSQYKRRYNRLLSVETSKREIDCNIEVNKREYKFAEPTEKSVFLV